MIYMKIEKIVDKIPNLDRVVDNENKGIEVHAEMPVVMADAYNESKKRNEIIENNFKDSMKSANEFVERNHNRDGFKMEASAPLKKLHLSESLFTEATQEFIDLADSSPEDKVNTENKDMWYFVYDLFCSDSKNYKPLNPVTGERIKRFSYEHFDKSGSDGIVIRGDIDFDEVKQICDYYELDYDESKNKILIHIPTNDDDTPMSIKEYSKFIGKPIQARFKHSNKSKDGLEESKQLKESWEYQDLIDDLVSRIDDPNDDNDVLQSIDDGLIYNRDLWIAIEENATTSEVLEALQDKGIDIYEIVIDDVYSKLKKKGLIESCNRKKKLVKEDVEDINVDNVDSTPEGPQPDSDEVGVASLLINAINDEWKTIEMYNSLVSTCAAYGEQYADFINVINDIVAEENVHIGQLQKALSTISPNVEKIDDGEMEAEAQLDEPVVEE